MPAQYPSFNDREFDLLKKLTNNSAELADGTGIPLTVAEANLLYFRLDGANSAIVATSSTVLTVRDGFSLTSAGSITLAAGGSNKNITFTPSGTGQLITVLSDANIYAGVQTGPALLAGDSGVQYAATGNYSGLSNVVYQNSVANVYPYFHLAVANGTASSPTNFAASKNTGSYIFAAYANGAFRQNAQITFVTDPAFGNTEYGGELQFHTSTGTGGMGARVGITKGGNVKIYGQTTAFASTTGNINVIGSDAVAPTIMLDGFGASPAYNGRRAAGTLASPTAVTTNQTLMAFNGRGYDGTAYSGAQVGVNLVTGDVTWTTSDHSTRISFNTTPPGSIAQSSGVVTIEPSGALSVGRNAHTLTAWGTTGPVLRSETGLILTDNTTAGSGTAAIAVFSSLAAPTLAATNATVTTTDAFNLYLAGPVANGANMTITRKHTLGVVDSTSAASSITGAVIIATTIGTTATSIGLGGGNINAGGTITAGGGYTSGSATLITTSVNLTNGAAAQAGTLLNAPAAGNPTKWIPLNDNGTTRYFPAW